MSSDSTPNGHPVPVAIGPPRGPQAAILVALLVVVVAAGAFGRLVPGVLVLRSTELLVRGVAAPGIRRIEGTVRAGGQPIGQAELSVGFGRQITGLVPITPPSHRTPATLEIREAGESDVIAQVSFLVEAGALLLPKDPSALHGRAGRVLIVDVLVYGRLEELRGLLTGVDGHLIATGSTMLSGTGSIRGVPRTVAIELQIPTEALPSRARLHLLGIDPAGIEVEHIDANVDLSGD